MRALRAVMRSRTASGRSQQLTVEEVPCYAIREAACFGPGAGAPDEFSIDVEGVDVARWSHGTGELDCRVPHSATEIGHHM
jgi:hypothetical protein